jgi:hypothetical protein
MIFGIVGWFLAYPVTLTSSANSGVPVSACREELREQRAQGRERFLAHPEVGPAAALLTLHEPCLQEHLEVMADRRLAEPERLGQVTDAGLVARLGLDQAQEPEPSRVGDRLQRAGELLGLRGREGSLKERGGRTRRRSRSSAPASY